MRSVLKCQTAKILLKDLPHTEQKNSTGAPPLSRPVTNSEPLLIAFSPVIQALVETIPRLAQQRTPVLILGETGTGKTLLAHALHAASEHRQQPLLTVPCALLAEREEPTLGCRGRRGRLAPEDTLASLCPWRHFGTRGTTRSQSHVASETGSSVGARVGRWSREATKHISAGLGNCDQRQGCCPRSAGPTLASGAISSGVRDSACSSALT